MNKDAKIEIRCSEERKRKIQAEALQSNMTVSKYILYRINNDCNKGNTMLESELLAIIGRLQLIELKYDGFEIVELRKEVERICQSL